MENKYYTPTIEEFHIGFECEWRRFEEDWHGGKINSSIELYDAAIEYEAGENQTYEYRVKYLDKEDIEDLNFVHKGAMWFQRADGMYRIRWWKDHEIDIWKGLNDLENMIIFRGTIKNKSELKVLLKQLGIE